MMAPQKVVTPAQAGVQGRRSVLKYWIPAFAGMTDKNLLCKSLKK